ncbi:MAG: sulfite exporter TauE/SafE family protein [Methanimicrococcus sp.]|nr:sulfite exporter TauE/SafE family protein [Methanimicrococcus sp.]
MDPSFFLFIIALLIGGAVAGSLSGILGIGGSIFLVPLQFSLLTKMGYAPDIALKVSIATSLFFMLPTSFSSAYGHSKRKAVLWNKAFLMGTVGFLFSFVGAYIASLLNAAVLSIFFGSVVFLMSFKFYFSKGGGEKPGEISSNFFLYVFCGMLMGLLSGLTGIGGGLILIPLLLFFAKIPLRKAVGTSSATIIFTSLGGIVSYIFHGFGVSGLPPYSLGYVNLLMWICLVIPGVMFAWSITNYSHKINVKYVRSAFSVFTFVVGLWMILKGVLEFL